MLLLLLFASYLHCVLTDPGTVPQAWHDRIASDPQLAARYRLCHKSGLYRPPRSHYCLVTERTLTLTPTPTLTQDGLDSADTTSALAYLRMLSAGNPNLT